MKHIEENFEKIMGNEIPKEELNILQPFLKELKDYQAVDCIYLVPTFKKMEFGRETFDYFYKQFCIILNKENISQEEYKQIQISIDKARFSLYETGYPFIDEYGFSEIDQFDQRYWKSLVSSYIIFDRNGKYGKIQDEIKNEIKPYKSIAQNYKYGSVAEIENIEELNTKPVEKVLKKSTNI